MTFFLKEVYDYSTAKSDGIHLNNLRRVKLEASNLRTVYERYNKINK